MSRSINKKILVGNLTSDPELRYTGAGTAVTNFTIATNESFKNADDEWEERATFHRGVAWGRAAEVISEYARKGSRMYVEGPENNTEYETEDDAGNTVVHRGMEMTVREFMFLDGRQEGSGAPSSGEDAVDHALAGDEPVF